MAESDHGIDSVPKTDKKQTRSSLSPGAPSFPFLSLEDALDVDDADLSSSDDEAGVIQISHDMKKLTMDNTVQRFFGKSSGAVLTVAARDVKNKNIQPVEAGPKVFSVGKPQHWAAQPVIFCSFSLPFLIHCSYQWVRNKLLKSTPNYEFPDEDLMWSLIDLYFNHANKGLPLLHRPTFEDQVANGFYRRDGSFGATLSLVCAIGARFSTDLRVLLDGTDSPSSAGWKWYDQVELIRNSLLVTPTIYEIQSYCVCLRIVFL
jgi:hypothetical protein